MAARRSGIQTYFALKARPVSNQESIRSAHPDFWIPDLRAAFAALVWDDVGGMLGPKNKELQ